MNDTSQVLIRDNEELRSRRQPPLSLEAAISHSVKFANTGWNL